jgi:hypothetical protein
MACAERRLGDLMISKVCPGWAATICGQFIGNCFESVYSLVFNNVSPSLIRRAAGSS